MTVQLCKFQLSIWTDDREEVEPTKELVENIYDYKKPENENN